jgi:hypothetical protein
MRRFVPGLITAVLVVSCATQPVINKLPDGNVRRLMERPDAEAARKAAPGFAQDALLTISDLEYQLATEKKKH